MFDSCTFSAAVFPSNQLSVDMLGYGTVNSRSVSFLCVNLTFSWSSSVPTRVTGKPVVERAAALSVSRF